MITSKRIGNRTLLGRCESLYDKRLYFDSIIPSLQIAEGFRLD